MLTAEPCPCGGTPKVEEPWFKGEWVAVCESCYDCDFEGDPGRYVSTSRVAHGRTREEAIEEWNESLPETALEHITRITERTT